MFIKVLDKDLSNMIAAGEVVERPASAVKELCENSIDAGAGSVTVEIRGGGLQLIKVTDNGCGIHPEDVANAFLRHATSKISTPADLDSIYTLGFRGEALASIASVANVELYTRTQEFETGMTCTANFGNVEQVQQTPGFIGTSIRVSNLFYNTPARMKFLKKDATEAGYVEEAVRKTALAHPEVSFRLLVDGKEKLFTPGDGILSNVLFSLYGKEVSAGMLPVDYSEGKLRVSGLVSNPFSTRKTRNMQSFFVNNRPIVSRMLTSALEEACKGQIPVGTHPLGVIKLDIPADTVDVNVHPAKLEVKFSDESMIYKAVYWAIKNASAKRMMPKITVPFDEKTAKNDEKQADFAEISADLSDNSTTPTPSSQQKQDELPRQGAMLRQNELPYQSQGEKPKDIRAFVLPSEAGQTANVFSGAHPFPVAPFEGVLQNITEKTNNVTDYDENQLQKAEKKPEYMQIGVELAPEIEYNIIGQVFLTYILVQRGSDLILIDQHAAHEHIVYARLLKQVKERQLAVQQLLTPSVIRLSPVEKAFALQNADFFRSIGFETEEFGNHDIVVRGVPEGIEFGEIGDVIMEIIAAAQQNKISTEPESMETALFTVACRAAIKAGKRLTVMEMESFVKELFAIEKTVTCPHGRPAFVALDKQFIEKQFKRIK